MIVLKVKYKSIDDVITLIKFIENHKKPFFSQIHKNKCYLSVEYRNIHVLYNTYYNDVFILYDNKFEIYIFVSYPM